MSTIQLPEETTQLVLVFKTNIRLKEDLVRIKSVLTRAGIYHWNVDTEDIDCVLRIERPNLPANGIISLLNEAGYFCKELED